MAVSQEFHQDQEKRRSDCRDCRLDLPLGLKNRIDPGGVILARAQGDEDEEEEPFKRDRDDDQQPAWSTKPTQSQASMRMWGANKGEVRLDRCPQTLWEPRTFAPDPIG